MRTEAVLDRLFSGEAVLTAANTHQTEVAGLLDERYGRTAPPPAPAPDEGAEPLDNPENAAVAFSYQQHIADLTSDLSQARDTLIGAEDQHQRKLALIDALMDQRDDLVGELSKRFFQVRHTIESVFGPGRGFALANVSGTTPEGPDRLVQQAAQTIGFLRDPAVETPAHGLGGVRVDLAQLADDLETPLLALRATLADLARVRKEAQGTLAVKRNAIEEFDGVFGWVSRALESLFHLAGQHALAERIRPTARRRGRASDEGEASETSSNEDSSGEDSSNEDSSGEDSSGAGGDSQESPPSPAPADAGDEASAGVS